MQTNQNISGHPSIDEWRTYVGSLVKRLPGLETRTTTCRRHSPWPSFIRKPPNITWDIKRGSDLEERNIHGPTSPRVGFPLFPSLMSSRPLASPAELPNWAPGSRGPGAQGSPPHVLCFLIRAANRDHAGPGVTSAASSRRNKQKPMQRRLGGHEDEQHGAGPENGMPRGDLVDELGLCDSARRKLVKTRFLWFCTRSTWTWRV